MKYSDLLTKKALFYNLIIFDFILLESSSKKISNFFIEKLKNKNFLMSRISLFPIIKNFKRFIRLLYFLKDQPIKKFFYFWINTEETLELLLLLFKKYKLSCILQLSFFAPFYKLKFLSKISLIFDQNIDLNNFLSFYFKKFHILHSFNSFQDSIIINTLKIFVDLNDYKKLLFICLIFISFFKK